MILYYLAISSILLTAIPFFYFEGHKITKNVIMDNYNKCQKLNTVVKTTTNGNRIKALKTTFQIISKMLWLMFLQWLNNSVEKVDRKTSVLTYVYAGKRYKLFIKPKRGPCPILQIIDENSEDVTEHVLPYMGPKYNWHGEKLSPKTLGYKTLTFECSNGKSLIFKNEEICEISV